MAIIVSDSEAATNEMLSSLNSMPQLNSDISTLIIYKTEIDVLYKNYLKSKEILLKFQMPIPRTDHVTLDFYIVPTDTKTYGFIRSFQDYAVKFENSLRTNFNFLKANDSNDSNLDKITRIVNCLSYAILFDVLGNFNEFCVSKGNITPDCLQDQIDAMENKYIAQARRCVQKNEPIAFLSQTHLHNSSGSKKSYVYVNGKNFHGSWKADNLFEAVCGGFTHAPEYCVYINNKYSPNTHYHDIKYRVKKDRIITILSNIAVALFLLILSGVCLFFIYEKVYKQMLEVKTGEIVRQSVIDYETIRNNE